MFKLELKYKGRKVSPEQLARELEKDSRKAAEQELRRKYPGKRIRKLGNDRYEIS